MAGCLAPQAKAAFALSVPTVVCRPSEASLHMENAAVFVFQARSHYWKPCADTYGPQATQRGQPVSQRQLWMFTGCSWREGAQRFWKPSG